MGSIHPLRSTAPLAPSNDPGPVRLVGDLWQVAGPTLSHPYCANAYLLAGGRPVLLDCGSARGAQAGLRNVLATGIEPEAIALLLATHCHYDHLSAAPALRALAPQLRLVLHPSEQDWARLADGDGTASFLYDEAAPPIVADEPGRDGETLVAGGARIDMLDTPGHSPGSRSFVVETGGARVLIAGDAVWGGSSPRIGSDLAAWERSLDRLCDLSLDAYCFGHGPVGLSFDAESRLAEARRQLRGDWSTPWFRRPCDEYRY